MSVQLRGILAAVTTPFTADGSAIGVPPTFRTPDPIRSDPEWR